MKKATSNQARGNAQRPRAPRRLVVMMAVLTTAAIAQVRADDWPEWRGKGRLGVWNDTNIVDKLPATLPIAWRVPINKGYSGPAVAGGRVFVTDARRTFGNRVIERILVLEETTGKTLWTNEWETDYSPMVDVWQSGR